MAIATLKGATMQSSRNGTILFSICFGVLVFSASSSNAAVWYVDAASTSGAPTGTNWCDAYPDLQDALADASFGEHDVTVSAGVAHAAFVGEHREKIRRIVV